MTIRRALLFTVGMIVASAGMSLASQAAVGGVVISGRVSPSPNAAGWNSTDVTVSFLCAGAGTITCPPPVTLTQEGEHDVAGQASSDNGATASTAVHVQIDKTAPAMQITSSVFGALVAPGQLTVTGTSFDALAGVTAVTCNDQPGVLDEADFACEVTIWPGISAVTVRVIDAASNARTTVVSVATTDTAISNPPTSLCITPQEATMVLGESRGFALHDNLDRVPSDAVWTVNAKNVVTEPDALGVTATATSAGDATLTAAWQGLTTTAHVTVLGVDTAPIGTILWVSGACQPAP